MSNEKTLLQQCIDSGQVSPEQIEAHRAVGDLAPIGTFEVESFSRKNMLAAFGFDPDTPISFEGSRVTGLSLTRQSVELARAERKALDEALQPARERLHADFFAMFDATHAREAVTAHVGNITEPKMCISCGRKQEPDGTLTCGH